MCPYGDACTGDQVPEGGMPVSPGAGGAGDCKPPLILGAGTDLGFSLRAAFTLLLLKFLLLLFYLFTSMHP